jgi:branched-chain amino acid transport system permease protein
MAEISTGRAPLVRRTPTRTWIALAAVLAVLIALPWIAAGLGSAATLSFATRAIILGIAAASLNLALGQGGLVSFGHAAFYGVGGYVVGILAAQFAADEPLFGAIPGTNEFLVAVPAAVIVSGLFALVLGALCLRTSGVQFIMITLAFAQMTFFLFVALKSYGGSDGLIIRRRNLLAGVNISDARIYYFLCLAIAAATFVALRRIARSRFGMMLDGIRQNERRVAAVGVSSYGYKLAAFAISGMGTGLAGALMANFNRFVSPDMLNWEQSGEFLVMIILGGVGTLWGPWIGAGVLIGLETVLAAWTENWPLALGLILVAVILFARGGLAGLLATLGLAHRD